MDMIEPGSHAHYAKWQPRIDHEKYTIDLRPLEGVASGQSAFGFTCLIALVDGETEQLPKFLGSAWSDNPSTAQYLAFKQAAYLLEFNTLPKPAEITIFPGDDSDYTDHMVDGLRVVPEYE